MSSASINVLPNGRDAYWDTKEGVLRSLRDHELSFSDLVVPANAQESLTIEQWLSYGDFGGVDAMRATVGFKERIGWLSIVAVLLTAFLALFTFYAADRASWVKEKGMYRNQVSELEAVAKQHLGNDNSANEVASSVADTPPPAKTAKSETVASSINATAPIGIQPTRYTGTVFPAEPLVQGSLLSWQQSVETPSQYAPAWAPSSTSFVAENGSYRGELNTSFVPKTVYVRGYYRRDGTYVRGHYRAQPRR